MDGKSFAARALGCILAATALVAWPGCKSRSLGNEDGGDAASGSAGTGGSISVGTAGQGGNSGAAGAAGATGGGTGGTGAAGTGGTTGAAGSGATGGASGGTGGGTAGRGGTGGRGGAGAASPECTSAADCKLVDDCCSCEAIPVGATAAPCALLCIQSACAARQLPSGAVDCVVGKCVAGFACDATQITCKAAAPICPAGQVPAVNAAGNCYVGTCVPETECTTVGGCGACTGANDACVSYQTQRGPQHHCVTIPPECNGNGGCDCVGVASCLAPYQTCTNYSGIRGVSCSCPTC